MLARVRNQCLATKFKLSAALITALLTANANAAFYNGDYQGGTYGWSLDTAATLWVNDAGGTSQIGTTKTHISSSADGYFNNANFGGIIALDAHKNNIGIFLHGGYIVITSDSRDGATSYNTRNRLGLISAGLTYKLLTYSKLTITPYAGFRYNSNDSQLSNSTTTLNANNSWIDPLFGSGFLYQFTKTISGTIFADIAGTNTHDQFSWNLIGILAYHPQTKIKNATFYLGYRVLNQSYKNGINANKFVWNMQISGPLAGVNFNIF